MADGTDKNATLCEMTYDDIETIAGADAVQHLGAAWRILEHVYGGKSPVEAHVVCVPCYSTLMERGLNKGVPTPSGAVAKEFADYVGLFSDVMMDTKPEDKQKVYAEWLKACPPFWRKHFEEDSAWDETLRRMAKEFPGAFDPKKDEEN